MKVGEEMDTKHPPESHRWKSEKSLFFQSFMFLGGLAVEFWGVYVRLFNVKENPKGCTINFYFFFFKQVYEWCLP